MDTFPVGLELIVPLLVSVLFSVLYELDHREMLWAGMIGMGGWIITSAVFLIVSAYPFISLLFGAIGLVYIVRVLLDLFKPLQDGRVLDDGSRGRT